MSRLIAFGDSFTYGTDLKDCVEGSAKELEEREKISKYHSSDLPFAFTDEMDFDFRIRSGFHYPSKKTWPALLAKYLDKEYVCHARPGSSNHKITRLIYRYLNHFNEDDLLVINWTWVDRLEWYNETLEIESKRWEQIRPDSTSKEAKLYYKHLFSELQAKYDTLQNIIGIYTLLKYKNIPFIMSIVDDITLDTMWNNPVYNQNIQNEIKDKLVWFEDKGFYHWAKDKNFAISETWHPLEEAHEAAFKHIRDNYDFT